MKFYLFTFISVFNNINLNEIRMGKCDKRSDLAKKKLWHRYETWGSIKKIEVSWTIKPWTLTKEDELDTLTWIWPTIKWTYVFQP